MSVKIGISPIAWQNDDLPDLTAAYTMEQALSEAREARARLEQRTEALILDAAGILPADVRRDAFDRALTRRHDHERRERDRDHEDRREDEETRPDHPRAGSEDGPRHEPPSGSQAPDLF